MFLSCDTKTTTMSIADDVLNNFNDEFYEKYKKNYSITITSIDYTFKPRHALISCLVGWFDKI